MLRINGRESHIEILDASDSVNRISDNDLYPSESDNGNNLYPSYMLGDNYSGWCQDNTSFGTFSGDEQDRLTAFWLEGVMVPTVGAIGLCGKDWTRLMR